MIDHLRVHIIPIGFDSTRVTEALIQRKADKVHFIRYTKDKEHSAHFGFIKKELHKKMKQLEIKQYFLNIWDLYECIEKFREIIIEEKQKGNHVFINVSTGSKITAIAGMLACMSWKAEPYYVQVNYEPQSAASIQKLNVKALDDLPVYEINKPKQLHMRILEVLMKNDKIMRKSKLIEELENMNIIKQKDDATGEFKIHAKYSQLHAVLKPLEDDWKFIKIKSQGKRSEVIITDQGVKALKIFGIQNSL